MMMKSLFLLLFLLLLCGCFKNGDNFSTLNDYARTFDSIRKVQLKSRDFLTLAEARELALANNPTLLAAANSIHSAQYSYYRSLSAWSPEISASWEVGNTLSQGNDLRHPPPGIFERENRFSTSGTLSMTWLLFNGLARELDILVAKLEYDRSIAAAEDVKRLLLRAVVYVWCDIHLATEEISIFQADEAFQNAALRQAQEQFKAGHISYAAVLNFKVLSAKARSRIELAGYHRQTAVNALAALLGYNAKEFPADIKLEAVTSPRMELHHPLEYYLEQAIRHRPDLRSEKLQFEKSIREKQSAYADFMPEFHLFADFDFAAEASRYREHGIVSSHYNTPQFAYGIVGKWNIFRGFDSWNELRRKKALEKVAFRGLNKKYLDVTVEVNDALEHCRNTLIQISIFREMALWVLEERNLIYSEYLNGRETIARVNQAQSELVEAQSSLVLWVIQSRKAFAQFQAALGTDTVIKNERQE